MESDDNFDSEEDLDFEADEDSEIDQYPRSKNSWQFHPELNDWVIFCLSISNSGNQNFPI